jgi:hypothetical protein
MNNITLVLPIEHVNVIFAALGERPLKDAIATFITIRNQVDAQQQPPQPAVQGVTKPTLVADNAAPVEEPAAS